MIPAPWRPPPSCSRRGLPDAINEQTERIGPTQRRSSARGSERGIGSLGRVDEPAERSATPAELWASSGVTQAFWRVPLAGRI